MMVMMIVLSLPVNAPRRHSCDGVMVVVVVIMMVIKQIKMATVMMMVAVMTGIDNDDDEVTLASIRSSSPFLYVIMAT
jgi:hypothetical protein